MSQHQSAPDTGLRFGIFLPPFDAYAEPGAVAALAADAERAGWDGFYVWDHIRAAPGVAVADPWVTMSAIATNTERIRIGALVTPLNRRRPWVVARQAVTLDRLSGGRLTLGIGAGSDDWHEFSGFGEQLQGRGALLDESLTVLEDLLAGRPVSHHGEGLDVETEAFRPGPVQSPLPIWGACRWPNRAPLARAARVQGCFPIFSTGRPIPLPEPEDIAAVVAALAEHGAVPGSDVAIRAHLAAEPTPAGRLSELEQAGVTWVLENFEPSELDPATVERIVRAGPPTVR